MNTGRRGFQFSLISITHFLNQSMNQSVSESFNLLIERNQSFRQPVNFHLMILVKDIPLCLK